MENGMTIKTLIKKIYTVAYRLTGDEKAACSLAEIAIEETIEYLNFNENEYENIFQMIVSEICMAFLTNNTKYDSYEFSDMSIVINQKTIDKLIQKAILTLEPTSRVIIIWRDILGFKLSEITPIINRTEKVLQKELSNARLQLMEQIKSTEYPLEN